MGCGFVWSWNRLPWPILSPLQRACDSTGSGVLCLGSRMTYRLWLLQAATVGRQLDLVRGRRSNTGRNTSAVSVRRAWNGGHGTRCSANMRPRSDLPGVRSRPRATETCAYIVAGNRGVGRLVPGQEIVRTKTLPKTAAVWRKIVRSEIYPRSESLFRVR